MLGSLGTGIRRRHNARKWVGEWEAYDLVGRTLSQRMARAGPTTVTLAGLFSDKLTFECYDCDANGTPTRRQKGSIRLDADDPTTAKRIGQYLDAVEIYEQRLRMIDDDAIVILPVPSGSSLGDVYGKHGWRRKN
jgi:hypothetical protein